MVDARSAPSAVGDVLQSSICGAVDMITLAMVLYECIAVMLRKLRNGNDRRDGKLLIDANSHVDSTNRWRHNSVQQLAVFKSDHTFIRQICNNHNGLPSQPRSIDLLLGDGELFVF